MIAAVEDGVTEVGAIIDDDRPAIGFAEKITQSHMRPAERSACQIGDRTLGVENKSADIGEVEPRTLQVRAPEIAGDLRTGEIGTGEIGVPKRDIERGAPEVGTA